MKEDIEYIKSSPLPWNTLYGKSILVSGATGMIPGYIVDTLLSLDLNIDIYILSRNKEKIKIKFGEAIKNKKLIIINQDVITPINYPVIFKFDYIIHGASIASPNGFKSDPIGTILPNVIGTYNLLQHAKNFLFISSPDVYGITPDIPISESDYGYIDPINPRSCYGTSKLAGESLCIAFKNQHNIPVKIVRPYHVYGPGLNLTDGRIFSDFVSNIINKEPILIKGSGNEQRTFCYLADAVLAIFYVLFHGQNGEAYNIGNDNCEIKLKDLAGILSEIYNLPVEYSTPSNTYLKSSNNRGLPDTAKIKSLGWRPKTLIEEGFKRTIQTFGNKQ